MSSKNVRQLMCAASLATVAGLVSGCDIRLSLNQPPLYKETRSVHVPHVGASALHVDSRNGSITAVQSDRDDVQVLAHLTATSAERLAAAEVAADRDEAGTLFVAIDWPEGKPLNREGCSFEVAIPDATDVVLRSSNGKIELAGLKGKADLTTSNGQIAVQGHGGPLEAITSNGPVKASAIEGTINASTCNGRIDLEGATNSVYATTSNGDISVSLAPEGAGPVNVRTSNGAVSLILSPVVAGQLILSTSNGAVQIDPSCEDQIISRRKQSATLEFDDSEVRSSATTSNGSIQVKRAIPKS
ncbi:MAG: hypothetical protein AAF961_05825 [Planctomycetota bacterium]